jgi:hypothetical protein
MGRCTVYSLKGQRGWAEEAEQMMVDGQALLPEQQETKGSYDVLLILFLHKDTSIDISSEAVGIV